VHGFIDIKCPCAGNRLLPTSVASLPSFIFKSQNLMVCRIFLTLLVALSAITAGAVPKRIPPLTPEPTNVQMPGKIIWADLFTTEPNTTTRFYSALFDWMPRTITDENGKYVVLSSPAGPVVGVARGPDRKDGRPASRWVVYFSSRNVARATAAVESNGGRVLAGPAAIPERGMHAIVADPEGALFGLMASTSGDPVDAEVVDGGLLWSNLFADGPTALAPFYGAVTGLEASPWNRGALLLSKDDTNRASISPLGGETTATATWVPFFKVSSLERKMRLARRLGAKLVVEPEAMENGTKVAVFADTTGGVFAMAETQTETEASP
jgi:hypothetical protein